MEAAEIGRGEIGSVVVSQEREGGRWVIPERAEKVGNFVGGGEAEEEKG